MARNPVIDASLGYLKQNYPNSRVTAFNDRNKGIGFKGLSDPPVIDTPVIDVSEFLEIGLPPESRFDVSDIPRPRTPAPPGLLENAAPTTEGFNVPNSMNSLLREGHFEGPHNIPSTPTINAEAPRELLSNMSDPRKQAFWGGLTQFGSELMTNPDGWGPGMSKFQQSLQAGRAQYKQEAIEAEERERKAAEDDLAVRRVEAVEGRLAFDMDTEAGRLGLAQNTFEENVRQFGLSLAQRMSEAETEEERAALRLDLDKRTQDYREDLGDRQYNLNATTTNLENAGIRADQAAERLSRGIQTDFVKELNELDKDPEATNDMKRALIEHYMVNRIPGMTHAPHATSMMQLLITSREQLDSPTSKWASEKEQWYDLDNNLQIVRRFTEGDDENAAFIYERNSETGEMDAIEVSPSELGWDTRRHEETQDETTAREREFLNLAIGGGRAHSALVYGVPGLSAPNGDLRIAGATAVPREEGMSLKAYQELLSTPEGWKQGEFGGDDWTALPKVVIASIMNRPTGDSPEAFGQFIRAALLTEGWADTPALAAHVEALNFINPIVRYLSGAQMTNQEAQRYYGALVPVPGEPPQVSFVKRLRRETLLTSMGLDPRTGEKAVDNEENRLRQEQASMNLGYGGNLVQGALQIFDRPEIEAGDAAERSGLLMSSLMRMYPPVAGELSNDDMSLLMTEETDYEVTQ
tara:strand:+ start:612 stop:2696 length:2085 start_codon:yes stop_codon:yes gene_type:complete